jgi:signal transduction histidine kinase
MTTAGRIWARIEAHPLRADIAVAAVALLVALISSNAAIRVNHFSDPKYDEPSNLAELAGLLAVIGPLAIRRRRPLASLLACMTGFVCARLFLDQAENAVVPIALSFSVYSAAAHGNPRWRNIACGICLLAITAQLFHEVNTIVTVQIPGRRLYEAIMLAVNVALFGAMWALGSALGSRRREARLLRERTVALEREREAGARRAVFEERVRIARELHDVVAHHVSLMGVQAGAARMVMADEPAKARQALGSIEASSRQTVEELHRLLGFLRQAGDPEELAPQPGVGQLSRLAAGLEESGLAVDLTVDGDERPLPPTVDVSAYRIVQEALTNTLKHSGAARATVQLRYRPRDLELEIRDDGAERSGAATRRSGGLGLIGMRERAALLGGSLDAGPAPGGGFRVQVQLPTPEGAL